MLCFVRNEVIHGTQEDINFQFITEHYKNNCFGFSILHDRFNSKKLGEKIQLFTSVLKQ